MTRLGANLVEFVRLLRRAGLPVGPAQTLDAVRAVDAVGLLRRDDVYWALHAVLVTRRREHAIFEEAFDLFWRDPHASNEALSMLLSTSTVPPGVQRDPLRRRLREAYSRPTEVTRPRATTEDDGDEAEIDAVMTFSDAETLRTRDFEQMSADELRRAHKLIARLRLPLSRVRTRRFRADPRGARIDMRRTLRKSLAGGGRTIVLARKSLRRRPPPIVALCDISGSMERYARVFLHFLHALTAERTRVTSFVFGTRLTNITRALRYRDVDDALARVGREVTDWSGGTRIGACLRAFNLRWARRVRAGSSVVVLMTDGLDRDPAGGLAVEAARLRRSCRRLVWLNPLLRYEGFEPRAAGIRALLPHVDDFRPAHDLASLEDVIAALTDEP